LLEGEGVVFVRDRVDMALFGLAAERMLAAFVESAESMEPEP
jgi:hypothetical protein